MNQYRNTKTGFIKVLTILASAARLVPLSIITEKNEVSSQNDRHQAQHSKDFFLNMVDIKVKYLS